MHPLRFFHIAIIFLFLGVSSYSQAYPSGEEKINLTDEQGRRQGYWKITGRMSVEEGFENNQLVEEGTYVDNKRVGLWKKYYPTGAIRSEINYENNHPRGEYRLYYPNGNLEEEGTWAGNKNTGEFYRYHSNGVPAQEFHFLKNGKRDGVQNYYYDNGNLQLTVEVKNGIADGVYKTFYPDGSIRSEKMVTEGKPDPETVKEYPPKKANQKMIAMPELPEKISVEPKEDKPNMDTFKRSGHNTLYNRNKQITQVGEFKEGRLWNGKWHRYDAQGKLTKIEVYREGKFIGYGLIEDADK